MAKSTRLSPAMEAALLVWSKPTTRVGIGSTPGYYTDITVTVGRALERRGLIELDGTIFRYYVLTPAGVAARRAIRPFDCDNVGTTPAT